MQQLSKQTGTRFSFNPGKVSSSRKISFSSRQQTIEQVLTQIRKTTGVGYKLIGNHIILVEQARSTVVKKRDAVNGEKKQSTGKLTTTKTTNTGKRVEQFTDARESMALIQSVSASSKSNAVPRQNKDTAVHAQDSATSKRDSVPSVVNYDTVNHIDTVVSTASLQGYDRIKKDASFLKHLAAEAGLQGLGINYGVNTGHRWLIQFSTGLGGGYFVTGQQFYYSFTLLKPVVYVKAQPKFFLNRDGAKEGNYLGLNLKYTTAQLFSKSSYDSVKWVSLKGYSAPALLTDVHWGFQTELGGRWHLDGHLGIGYAFDFRYRWGSNHWYPAVGLKVCYQLKN
jgi:hypothetical protein